MSLSRTNSVPKEGTEPVFFTVKRMGPEVLELSRDVMASLGMFVIYWAFQLALHIPCIKLSRLPAGLMEIPVEGYQPFFPAKAM